jgi:glycosyltransferase involved in cell wall biosynthesis
LKTSLVVTTYNRPDALALVLRSALAQRRPPDEILVADDGSRDETRVLVQAIARDAPVPVVHCWQPDDGFRVAAIRNEAFARVSGDYVLMIDGDIVLHPAFVADHVRAARPGWMTQGSRVLLGEARTRRALAGGFVAPTVLSGDLRNRFNALRAPWLSPLLSRERPDVFRVRTANLGCWLEDVVRVNGFDERFVGWGREDSEFTARMFHAGVRLRQVKLAAIGYHLWHPDASRAALARNDALLEATLRERPVRCDQGIDRRLQRAPGT